MNPRGRYPPGIGNGGGGGNFGVNPNFYGRNPHHHQQQYVPRNLMQGQQNPQFQHQQQQWLRRNQMGSDCGSSEAAKAVQSDGIDSRNVRSSGIHPEIHRHPSSIASESCHELLRSMRRWAHSAASSSSSAGAGGNLRRQNRALSDLIRHGRLCEARRAFDALPQRDVVTWNAMLSAYANRRELARARDLFDRMPHRDLVSWNAMLAAYAASRDPAELAEGRHLFDRMRQRDVISWNTMINGYTRNGRMEEAMRLFERMPERNVISWNTVITGFFGVGDVKRAMEMFIKMPVRDAASLNAVTSGLIQNGRLEAAEEILLQSEETDAVDAYNTLIVGYGQSGRIDEARRLFDLIPCWPTGKGDGDRKNMGNHKLRKGFVRNVVSWNSMIMCYVKHGDLQLARALFDKMPERDLVSWNTMISGYAQALEMDEAESLFRALHDPDSWSWNSMICGFIQKGEVEQAHKFFDRMPEKSLVSWNTMIAGYEQNEDYEKAVKLFIKLQEVGERPDKHTLSSVLSACSGLASLRLGAQVHQLVMKTVVPDTPINNSLITMYSRCGNMVDAKAVFDAMQTQRDVVSWNAMIGGCAHHGFAREALELFKEMKRMKVKPTHITYVSILSACAHAGLVAEGRREFDSMVHEFGIMPDVEHYASLVDLIGRQGQLGEAMEVINAMLVPPDRSVWGAFLSACRVHKNVALARVAVEALVKLEPESSAPYVLLHNLHTEEGRWDDATEVREMMDRNRVVKHPGYSWIEMRDSVQIFISGDTSHPLSHEIFSLLESFNRLIRDSQLD